MIGTLLLLAQQEEDTSRGPATWDWDFAREILPDVWDGMVDTIQLTVVALVLAMTLGLVLAMLRRSRFRLVRWPVGFAVEFIRSTPLLVQFYFLYFVLPTVTMPDIPNLNSKIVLSAWQVGVIGLGVHYACYTSESYRAGIESVDRGQWEASTSLNLSTVTTWRSVILPQAIPTVIPALGNYLVAAFKDAPIASVVGLAGVLTAARGIRSDTFRGVEAFTEAGVLFLAVSIPLVVLARYLEKRYGYQRE
jgi:polar amino acid transport system permease protein